MAAPPLTENELKRLQEAYRGSIRDTEDFRTQRNQAIRAFAGFRYGEHASPYKTPMNILDMFITTYSNALVPDNPHLLVTSEIPSLKGDAHNIRLATDRWVTLNRFSVTMRECVRDALFGLGIVKVGESLDGQADYNAKEMGCVFAESVQFDDYTYDVQARRWDEISFEGNEYSVGFHSMMESDYYDEEAKKRLQPSDDNRLDQMGNERVSILSRGSVTVRDGYRDLINLVDVFLPYENLILTFAKDGDWSRPLHWAEWDGPNRGPYHKLFFGEVPGNITPKSFAAELFDLHDAYNRLLNKCVRSAEREKTIPVVSPGQDEDADRLNKARDGESTKVTSGAMVQEAHFGGVSQTSMAFVIALYELFNKRAGNMDLMAGLGAQSPTLGQDDLLSKAASSQVKYMQREVQSTTANVLTDVASYLYNNPTLEIPLIYKMPGYSRIQHRRLWTPEERRGDFLAYNFEMDVYSDQMRTPAEQLQIVMQFVNQVLMPAIPLLQAQGIQLNMKALIGLFSQLMNVKGMEDLVTYSSSAPNDEQPQQIGEGPRMPSVTQRTHVRENRPSVTSSDKLGSLAQALLSGGADRVQPKQMATVMR